MALAGIKPGPHWWEASTLTTATSLLLQRLLYELVYGNLIILNELQYLEISLSWVSCGYLSWLNWNLECWFLWREKKPEILEKNPVNRVRTNKKLNPHIPHQWQASALKITAPPPMIQCAKKKAPWSFVVYIPLLMHQMSQNWYAQNQDWFPSSSLHDLWAEKQIGWITV